MPEAVRVSIILLFQHILESGKDPLPVIRVNMLEPEPRVREELPGRVPEPVEDVVADVGCSIITLGPGGVYDRR